MKFWREITGNAPYLLVFTKTMEISDIEFVSPELTVKYSSFFGGALMDNTESYDVSDFFEWSITENAFTLGQSVPKLQQTEVKVLA